MEINNLIKFVDPTAGSAGTPQFKTLLSYQFSNVNALSTIKGGNEASSTNGTYLQFFVNSSTAVNTPLNLLTLQSSFSNGTNANFNCDVGVNASDPVKTLDVRGQLAISNNASSYWYLDRNDSSGNFDIINDSNQVKLTISDGGETTITATSTSGLILAQTGQSYYHNIRNQGDGLYIGVDDGGQGGSGADFRINIKGSEKMRITSGGNVLFGRQGVPISSSGTRIDATGESYNSITNNINTFHIYDVTNGIYRFYVSGAGQINATSTSITGISDISLKENIKTLETGLDEVIKLQPRRFDWKNGDGKNIAGFVAQEVEEILPDLVSEINYNANRKEKSH